MSEGSVWRYQYGRTHTRNAGMLMIYAIDTNIYFLIGAHALECADALITRDRGFMRKWFSDLQIIDPSVSR